MALTQDWLRSVIHYDPETGVFTHRRKWTNACKPWKPIGSEHGNGYLRIGLLNKRFFAHRLAWFYVHGEWPSKNIDHINGDRKDNRIANLRDVSQQANNLNQRRKKKNSTGLRGVTEHRPGQFVAQIQFKGKHYYLGSFRTAEDGHAAYLRARADILAGEFDEFIPIA